MSMGVCYVFEDVIVFAVEPVAPGDVAAEDRTPVSAKGGGVGTDQQVLCIGCGYDVRGLDGAGRCPECACPIARSIEARRQGGTRPLHLSDRRWVRRLTAGTACIFVASVLPHLLLLYARQE